LRVVPDRKLDLVKLILISIEIGIGIGIGIGIEGQNNRKAGNLKKFNK